MSVEAKKMKETASLSQDIETKVVNQLKKSITPSDLMKFINSQKIKNIQYLEQEGDQPAHIIITHGKEEKSSFQIKKYSITPEFGRSINTAMLQIIKQRLRDKTKGNTTILTSKVERGKLQADTKIGKKLSKQKVANTKIDVKKDATKSTQVVSEKKPTKKVDTPVAINEKTTGKKQTTEQVTQTKNVVKKKASQPKKVITKNTSSTTYTSSESRLKQQQKEIQETFDNDVQKKPTQSTQVVSEKKPTKKVDTPIAVNEKTTGKKLPKQKVVEATNVVKKDATKPTQVVSNVPIPTFRPNTSVVENSNTTTPTFRPETLVNDERTKLLQKQQEAAKKIASQLKTREEQQTIQTKEVAKGSGNEQQKKQEKQPTKVTQTNTSSTGYISSQTRLKQTQKQAEETLNKVTTETGAKQQKKQENGNKVVQAKNVENKKSSQTTKEQKEVSIETQKTQYLIKKGDNLWNIVKKHYGLSTPKDIADAVIKVSQYNSIYYPNRIRAGDTITLPGNTKTIEIREIWYNVREGDSLSKIVSEYYRFSSQSEIQNMIEKIVARNKNTIKDKDQIQIGQKIILPVYQ